MRTRITIQTKLKQRIVYGLIIAIELTIVATLLSFTEVSLSNRYLIFVMGWAGCQFFQVPLLDLWDHHPARV